MRVLGLLLTLIGLLGLILPVIPASAQSPTNTPTGTATPNLFAQPTMSNNWLGLPEKTPIPIDPDYTGNLHLNVDTDDITAEGINMFRTLLAVYRGPAQMCASIFFIGFGLSIFFRTFQILSGRKTNEGYVRGGFDAFKKSFRREVNIQFKRRFR